MQKTDPASAPAWRPGAFFFELWADPLVIVTNADQSLWAGLLVALQHARGRPFRLLAQLAGPAAAYIRIFQDVVAYAKREAGASITFTAPDVASQQVLETAGLDVIVAHHNAFLDERLFYPEPGAPKLYDAVHNAQAARFKRHELAFRVRNLALITMSERNDDRELRALVGRYENLAYANYDAVTGHKHLSPDEIRGVICRARCGLILSAIEGGNYASAEYLLCGVPVVTTPSIGGREAFFDPQFVRWVEPDPAAVQGAVAAFRQEIFDPVEVRASALRVAIEHRGRLIDWLSGVVGRDLLTDVGENRWHPCFRDKLRSWRALSLPKTQQ